MRQQIDNIDKKIVALLEERFSVVKKIGQYKKKHDLPILNERREGELISSNTNNPLIKKIFLEIVRCSRLIQEKL